MSPRVTLRSSVAIAAFWCGTALAAPPPSVTVSGHDNVAQVVFTFPRGVGLVMDRKGNTLQFRFRGAGAVPAASGDGHVVTSLIGGKAQASLALVPGTQVQMHRKGNAIIVDLTAPPLSPPPAPQAAAPPQPDPPSLSPDPPPVLAAAPLPPPAPPPMPPAPAPADAPTITALAGADGAARLPFDARSGAASFRRHGVAWVVFDQRRQIDLSALADIPLFAQATVQLLPNATVLRLPLPEGHDLRLSHESDGWTLGEAPQPASIPVIDVTVTASRFELAANDPGNVVTVPDTQTGQNLLVGTLRKAPAGMPVARRVPAFALEPSWMGVLVEPSGDRVTLRVTTTGFVVGTGDEPLSPAPDAAKALATAAALTRRFDLPAGPPGALLRRLQTQIADAAAAPAQSRSKPRKEAATTMIALGLGVEAQAMLQLATEQDPRLLADPDVIGLSAVGAILAARPAESGGINDKALDGTDEIAFWRAVRLAQANEHAPEAASVFATTANLVLAYPVTIRHALLPLVVETMAIAGAPAAADAILAQQKDEPSLALARAIRQEAKGEAADALARYDTLAQSGDRLIAARAAHRAITLRLNTNAITPTQAADALEKQFYAWRGDEREMDLRLRVAALRAQTGAWRPAFALLKETAQLYPDQVPMIQERMADLMTTLIKGPGADQITPLEMIALAEENAELVANVGTPQATALIADKLLALDLPGRAGPVLQRMMHAAPVGPGQATLGARLATLWLGQGDIAGAETALADSNAPGLPAPLIERRSLLGARIAARTGHLERAQALLVDLGTAAADDLRATLLTQAQDWPGAASALNDLAAKTVPPIGVLTSEQQDTLLRLASSLSRAKDMAGLQALGARYGSRLQGPRGDMFRLLTAPPVTKVSDLPRASAEIALARAIPGAVTAIGTK